MKHRRERQGSALLAVFWIMAIMGLGIVASMRVVSYQMNVVSAQTDGIKARQLAERGIALAKNPQVNQGDPILTQQFEEGEGFEVKILSQGDHLNINFILLQKDKRLLRYIFTEWGVDFDEASEIVDALVDWVDENEGEELNGAEFPWYERNGLVNQPYNRPFYNLDEMRLVRGMDTIEAVQPEWRQWFTVFSTGPLAVNEASAELLAMVAEGDIQEAQSLVEIIDGADGIRDTEDDQPFVSLDDALSMLGISPGEMPIMNGRFALDDEMSRIESIGSAGGVRREVVLVARIANGRLTIYDRWEEVMP